MPSDFMFMDINGLVSDIVEAGSSHTWLVNVPEISWALEPGFLSSVILVVVQLRFCISSPRG